MRLLKGFSQPTPPLANSEPASSVLRHDAHICIKPAKRATTRGRLRNVNAARGYPNEDAAIMPQG